VIQEANKPLLQILPQIFKTFSETRSKLA